MKFRCTTSAHGIVRGKFYDGEFVDVGPGRGNTRWRIQVLNDYGHALTYNPEVFASIDFKPYFARGSMG